MITIKHQGRRKAAATASERKEEKFKKFNFTFNINYLFYLFKHRILIILNSPRVFLCCCFFFLCAIAVLRTEFFIYSSTDCLRMRKSWMRSMRNLFYFKDRAIWREEKLRWKLFFSKCEAFSISSLLVFFFLFFLFAQKDLRWEK